MPVCLIEGPTLSKDSKAVLLTKVLTSLVNAYQMPDDRVYINQYREEDYGHSPIDKPGHEITIQTDKPRIVISIIAPPGLTKDLKRIMFRDITEAAGTVYGIKDLRDILTFLNEHPLENVASNGYIQTENPDFLFPQTQN